MKIKKCCKKREENTDDCYGIDYNDDNKFRVFYDEDCLCLRDIEYCPYCAQKLELE